MWVEPSIADIADEVHQCLARGEHHMAVRQALRFVERYDRSTWEVREEMVQLEPYPTGSTRFDALLAAVVEYSCAVRDVAAPAWVDDDSRFLDEFWFVAGMPSLEADALASTPISFARRGVFINSGALTYA